ncbi:Hypothetical protein CINCED_3A005207 [Cinara cedri]|uniref:Uncharacterized protein n=1 Tax=Cinara cedri TaxID=506608 RepID=A0A5E4MX12_9HEMI|nr:Hypothetical protein CINCED_3A005207 [Cinara cedri]
MIKTLNPLLRVTVIEYGLMGNNMEEKKAFGRPYCRLEDVVRLDVKFLNGCSGSKLRVADWDCWSIGYIISRRRRRRRRF